MATGAGGGPRDHASVPREGLEVLTLLGDVLDRAVERARHKPGWGGAPPMPVRVPLRAGTEAWSPAPGWDAVQA